MRFALIRERLKKLNLIYFLLLSIGFVFGWLGFLIFGNIASLCNVVVVSKTAILELERERVKSKDGSFDVKDMFFGNQKEFIDLVVKYANSLKNKKTKVILVSDDTGNVSGGQNITAEIYMSVVQHQKLNNSTLVNRVKNDKAKELLEILK